MGYSGLGPREDSSGSWTHRGGITKTGNAHLRRIVAEAAWAYRHRPSIGRALRKWQTSVSDEVRAIGGLVRLGQDMGIGDGEVAITNHEARSAQRKARTVGGLVGPDDQHRWLGLLDQFDELLSRMGVRTE